MAHRTLEQALAAMRAERDADTPSEAAIAAALRHRSGLVVAGAAAAAAAHGLRSLAPAMEAATPGLVTGGRKRDPGCRGKVALVEALHALEVPERQVRAAGALGAFI